ncbi:DNA polymerase Y family protein [Arcanobacterium haemolyticum]|nr:DNA polymerase Y family protein [Arcanobacterium haemolyticum]
MRMMQGALWIPDWPVTAAEQAGEVRAGSPAFLCSGKGVQAANVWARNQGVHEGMSKRLALSFCPHAHILSPRPERDTEYFEEVLRAVDKHVARITILQPGSIIFAARGAIRMAGSAQALADALIGEVAENAGYEAYVGFAEGTLAALLAARHSVVVPSEETENFLRQQPLDSLLIAVEYGTRREDAQACIEMLERLGVRTVGGVKSLGAAAMSSRFGEIGRSLWQLSAGENVRLRSLPRLMEELTFSHTCEPVITTADAAAFVAKQLATELGEEMTSRSLSGGRLYINASLENGSHYERAWQLEHGGVRDVVDRVRWQLGSWLNRDEERSAITRIELRLNDAIRSGERPDPLWGGKSAHDEQVLRTASRLQSILGEDEVASVEKVGGRTPWDAFQLRMWGEDKSVTRAEFPWPGAIPAPAPTLIHDHSIAIDVYDASSHAMTVNGDGELACIRQCPTPEPRFLTREGKAYEIVNYAGPWIIEEQWWDPNKHTRRAYVQFLCDHEGILAYRESGTWQEKGRYV